MNSWHLCNLLIQSLTYPLYRSIHDEKTFKDSIWFWREVMQRNLLRFLDFAVDATLVSTAKSLLYAYTYSGTMESLVRLSQGLFGQRSLVLVDDKDPAVIEIVVENANEYFLYALAKNDYALAIEESFALATTDLADVVSYDPQYFFRLFLTPGRVLRHLTITSEKGETLHAD